MCVFRQSEHCREEAEVPGRPWGGRTLTTSPSLQQAMVGHATMPSPDAISCPHHNRRGR